MQSHCCLTPCLNLQISNQASFLIISCRLLWTLLKTYFYWHNSCCCWSLNTRNEIVVFFRQTQLIISVLFCYPQKKLSQSSSVSFVAHWSQHIPMSVGLQLLTALSIAGYVICHGICSGQSSIMHQVDPKFKTK